MAESTFEFLVQVPLFAELDPADVRLLADSMRRLVFRSGEIVTQEGGDSADGFFVIESGEAEVTVQGQTQGTIGPGDCFGEIALLTGSERAATIRAITDLHCFGLAPPEFQVIVEGSPSIAWELYQSMLSWGS